ncbi:unnamed protein product [Penicillium egyptiacum]|uniref:Brr2 N-terminal helicase PWI domain-containing protein n=1 Tax=Penicillium egyptiacum TaxID=1303716 RepID=A0A9W4P4K9_9EURO|nr:unnamed protein product [Penicillium egyptiacum]
MDSVAATESQWLTQLAAMRQAIADLKLPQDLPHESISYGSDIDLDIDDDYSSPGTNDDVWDIISSDDETSDDLDDLHGLDGLHLAPVSSYNRLWLEDKCQDLAVRNSTMDATELAQQVIATLAADSNDEELQMSLAEIVGFDDLDLVIELIAHRGEILSDKGPRLESQTDGLMAGRLQTRAEREHALQQRDFEHKHAALMPAQTRSEPSYPHRADRGTEIHRIRDSGVEGWNTGKGPETR